MEVGNYEDFTTVYRVIDSNAIQYSNDGSIYVEPEPIPIPEPHIPTIEEVRSQKIAELSSTCSAIINAGADVEIDGEIEHFSYATAEDQANIKELFDASLATKLPAPYHSDGNPCKEYTAEQIINIYVACASMKTIQTTYHNQLKEYVKTLNTIEKIESVTYGQKLTGTYLETFNSLIASATTLMETLISGNA